MLNFAVKIHKGIFLFTHKILSYFAQDLFNLKFMFVDVSLTGLKSKYSLLIHIKVLVLVMVTLEKYKCPNDIYMYCMNPGQLYTGQLYTRKNGKVGK